MHHYECVAPNVDIILQSGRFWATSIASFRERFNDSRSCWVVFIHVLRGRPGGLLQFSKGEAVKICLASDWSGIRALWLNRERRRAWKVAERCGCSVFHLTLSFRRWWYHLITSSLLLSGLKNVFSFKKAQPSGFWGFQSISVIFSVAWPHGVQWCLFVAVIVIFCGRRFCGCNWLLCSHFYGHQCYGLLTSLLWPLLFVAILLWPIVVVASVVVTVIAVAVNVCGHYSYGLWPSWFLGGSTLNLLKLSNTI